MLLQHIFSVDRIKVALESEDKEELFEELVDICARSSTKQIDRASVLEAIRERESKMSTGIKKGIAIPHGKTHAVDSVTGVIGISKNGIDYDSLDGEPVYLVFLLVSSLKDSEMHLRALKKIAILLENPNFTDELLKTVNPESAHKLLRKYEDLLSQD